MAKNGVKHEGNAYNKDITAMTMPLFVMAFFYYGPRVILLAAAAVITAKLADRLASLLRGRQHDATENSSVPIALIIVLLMPATVRYRVVIAAVLIAVLVAKEAFGGYNSYPFNPSAVGFCVAAVSWPEEVFRYPMPTNWLLSGQLEPQQLLRLWSLQDQTLTSGPSLTLKNGGLPNVDTWNLLLGNYAAPLGVAATVVVLACAIYLVVRGRMPLATPLSFIAMCCIVAYFFPRGAELSWFSNPFINVAQRLDVVKYELLGGSMAFAAVFLVNEPGTLPKNTVSRVIYGLLLGFATMMFRYFGIYELGACFALLLVNAISGYFDRAVARAAARRKKVPVQ